MPRGVYKRTKPVWNKGKKLAESHAKKCRVAMLGKKHSLETRLKMSEAHLGEKNHNYINGVSRFIVSHYNDLRYKLWREAVFQRDNWTCQNCGTKGGYLEPHHIKSWAKFVDLRFELDNGQTLCKTCHKLTDNYAGKNNRKI